LIAQGHDNPAISEILFISRYTVEQHRKNIRSKIECNNYADMIKFALAFELFP
jgi:DNA-binding CsgD family transcriptional regulator